jgi:hypothetical protein
VAPHRTRQGADTAPHKAAAATASASVPATRPEVVHALLGVRADLLAQADRDHARASLWAVYAAEGGLLCAELAAGRWGLLRAAVRLAWVAGTVYGRWQSPRSK